MYARPSCELQATTQITRNTAEQSRAEDRQTGVNIPPGGRQSARQLREPEAEVAFKGAAIASVAIVLRTEYPLRPSQQAAVRLFSPA